MLLPALEGDGVNAAGMNVAAAARHAFHQELTDEDRVAVKHLGLLTPKPVGVGAAGVQ
jgi:hypothetical protein